MSLGRAWPHVGPFGRPSLAWLDPDAKGVHTVDTLGCPQEVRVNQVDGKPWWVAKDVSNALDYGKSRIAELMGRLADDEKAYGLVVTLGGIQEMRIVNEAGLYSLLLRSNKPEAKEFKRWLTHIGQSDQP